MKIPSNLLFKEGSRVIKINNTRQLRVISVSETKDLPTTLSTLLLKEVILESYQN
jgi:hypothetical protein